MIVLMFLFTRFSVHLASQQWLICMPFYTIKFAKNSSYSSCEVCQVFAKVRDLVGLSNQSRTIQVISSIEFSQSILLKCSVVRGANFIILKLETYRQINQEKRKRAKGKSVRNFTSSWPTAELESLKPVRSLYWFHLNSNLIHSVSLSKPKLQERAGFCCYNL